MPKPGGNELCPQPRLAFAALALAGGVFLMVGLLAGCEPAKKTGPLGHPPVVGFSLDSLVVERWKRDVDVFTKAVSDLGGEVRLEVADQDAGVQEQQVRSLALQGIDVLVIVPNDADKLTAVVKEVRSRGIPVLSYDRLVRKAGVDLYISFDNEKVGSLMTTAMLREVPQGRYLIINGAKSDNNAHLLNQGFHSAIQARVDSGQVQLAGELWPETWDSDVVRRDFEAWLAVNPKVDAILAGNDMLAEAAIGVLSESGLSGQVRVAGQDADLAACQRIAEGSQFATIYKPIDHLALRAAGLAVMLANHEKVETTATLDDGAGPVPYVRLEPTLVTKDLLESTVIHDGFHKAAEVYRNLR